MASVVPQRKEEVVAQIEHSPIGHGGHAVISKRSVTETVICLCFVRRNSLLLRHRQSFPAFCYLLRFKVIRPLKGDTRFLTQFYQCISVVHYNALSVLLELFL